MSDQLVGIISGFTSLTISIILAVFSSYGSFKLFKKLTKNNKETDTALKENNISVALVLSSMLLTMAFILKTVLDPMLYTLQSYLYQGMGWSLVAKLFGLFLAYSIATFTISTLVIWLALFIFTSLTKGIDELAEIKKGNVATAIVIATVIITVGILVSDGVKVLLDGLVPLQDICTMEISSK